MAKDYIPSSNVKLVLFEQDMYGLVNGNKVAWNIPDAKVAEFDTNRLIYEDLFGTISNPSGYTKAQMSAFKTYKKTFVLYVRGFVNEFLINNSAIPRDKKILMGLKPRGGPRTPKPKINTAPLVSLNPLEGAVVDVTCRVTADSNRPSRHPDSGGLQVRYAVGTVAPAQWSDADRVAERTRARFIIELDVADAGKNLYVFIRWMNFSDASKCGPFCLVQQTVIRG